jgi:hypothetical protein
VSWKTGLSRPTVGKVLRHAELAELLPETGQAWRDGTITTTAVELIAAARVQDCDEELAAMEGEFLDRAMRGDHKSLKILTQHFKACARADGSKPEPPDECKLARSVTVHARRLGRQRRSGRRSDRGFTPAGTTGEPWRSAGRRPRADV